MGMERLAGHRVIPREPEVPSCWAEQLQAPNTDSNGHYQMQIRKFKSWLDTTYEDKVSSPKPKQMWVMLSGRGAPAAHHDRNLKTGLAKKKNQKTKPNQNNPRLILADSQLVGTDTFLMSWCAQTPWSQLFSHLKSVAYSSMDFIMQEFLHGLYLTNNIGQRLHGKQE